MSSYEELAKQQKQIIDSINTEKLNLEEATKSRQRAESEITVINSRLKQKESDISKLEAKIIGLTVESESLYESVSSLKVQYKEISDKLEDKSNNILDIDKKTTEINKHIEDKKRSGMVEYEGIIKDKIKELNNLSLKLTDVKDAMRVLEAKHADMVISHDKTKEEESLLLKSIKNSKNEIEILSANKTSIEKEYKMTRENTERLTRDGKIEMDSLNKQKEKMEEETILVRDKLDEEKQKLESILLNGSILLAREDYVIGQEIYLKEQFKRLGIEYQPYVKS